MSDLITKLVNLLNVIFFSIIQLPLFLCDKIFKSYPVLLTYHGLIKAYMIIRLPFPLRCYTIM